MAFFCTKTGVRIAKPGVSKAVDPVNGHDEVIEVDGEERVVKAKPAKPADAKPGAPPPKGEDKPADAPKGEPGNK